MGQANKRGNSDQRKLQSILEMKESLPKSIKCDICNIFLDEVIPTNLGKKMFDINHFGFAYCKKCNKITICIGDTNSEKVHLVRDFIKENGQDAFNTILDPFRDEYIRLLEKNNLT